MAKSKHPAFDALTPKQRQAVLCYLRRFNQTQAMREAGYSPKTANQQGSHLFAKLNVQQAVSELLNSHGITPERISTALAEIAFGADVADFEQVVAGVAPSKLRAQGVNTKLIHKLKATRRVVGRGDDAYEVEDVALEVYNRQAALDSLSRIRGMVTEKREVCGKLEVDGQVDVSVLTQQELERLAHTAGEEAAQ